MNRIWAPWRMEYIEEEGGKDAGCIFCTKPSENDDVENLILDRGKLCFTIMNRYPYNNGHIMVAPYRHINNITLLTDEEFSEMHKATNKGMMAIDSVMKPDGYNIGMNIGKVAGAGFEGHVHLHIVPRWNGDTNFMPVLADIKVMPEHIRKTYGKILEAMRKL